MSDKNAFIDVIDKMLASKDMYNIHIAAKRIEIYELEKYIDKTAMLLIELFANDNPSKAMFMITLFMNYYHKYLIDTDSKINWDIISTSIFPLGFIKDEVLFGFIDDYIKTHKCMYHEIYNAI